MDKKKILSISYDESLLRTRQMLLERAGFAVTSVIGVREAIERCKAEKKFDLVLMGHSMPQKDKAALITIKRDMQELRQPYPQVHQRHSTGSAGDPRGPFFHAQSAELRANGYCSPMVKPFAQCPSTNRLDTCTG